MMVMLIVVSVTALAWWNGANDNFKGAATLYGSGAMSYRGALALATVTQLAGSLMATLLAAGLIKTFSAKGLVPDAVAADPAFIAAVAIAAMLTILLATVIGMPVSTTHALTGGLVGAGLVAVGTEINISLLGKSFFLPLLVSPVIAMAVTVAISSVGRVARKAIAGTPPAFSSVATAPRLTPIHGTSATCGAGRRVVAGISLRGGLDGLHVLSAGAICFARALNDTPKILGLCLAAKALDISVGLPLFGAAMALGGLLNARKVAHTMAKKITLLNTEQGLIANLTTALLVIVASRAGLPVSTTHVSTSAMFGIGLVNRSGDRRTISAVVLAWFTTLPVAAMLGAGICWGLIR